MAAPLLLHAPLSLHLGPPRTTPPPGLLLLVVHRGDGVHGLHFGSCTLLWPSHARCFPGFWGREPWAQPRPPFPFTPSAKTRRRPEGRAPSFSRVKVADIFHRLVSTRPRPPPPRLRAAISGRPSMGAQPCPAPLQPLLLSVPKCGDRGEGAPGRGSPTCGSPTRPLTSDRPQGPLSVFSAKNRWRLAGPIHVARGEGGFGFTLRGDAPVLIAAVVPGGRAAVRAPTPGLTAGKGKMGPARGGGVPAGLSPSPCRRPA